MRAALADVVRGIEDGSTDTTRARTLVYALSVLASVVKDDAQLGDHAARLAKIEEALRITPRPPAN